MTQPTYDADFYATRSARTSHAAECILACLFEAYHPSSAVDIGCGTGTWLSAARRAGATEVHGIEGTWLPETGLDIESERIERRNLEERITGRAGADLAISLEVAEHRSPDRGPSFVADLCALAPVVLFSAAIPGQGGLHHIHERWQSYWISLFAEHGYDAFDMIRPVIWHDDGIDVFYRQNTFVFVARSHDLAQSLDGKVSEASITDIVHPVLFTAKHNQRVAVRRNWHLFCRAVWQKAARLVGRRVQNPPVMLPDRK